MLHADKTGAKGHWSGHYWVLQSSDEECLQSKHGKFIKWKLDL